jgi:hypothetical protein
MSKTRCVFYVGGYEPLPAAKIFARFERGLQDFRRTWSVFTELSSPMEVSNGCMTWRIRSSGPNWRVDADVLLLDWSDLVADFTKVSWQQILLGYSSLFYFLLSSASIKYLRLSRRYMVFCIYPALLLGLFVIIGFTVGSFVVPSNAPFRFVAEFLLGVACFAFLVRWTGQNLYLNYALLDWKFAADIVQRRYLEFEDKLDCLAATVADQLQRVAPGEIIIFGHSLGAVVMMQIVARILKQNPTLKLHTPRLYLITAGSSLLKIGLHPAADHLRNDVASIIAHPAIHWMEYQALVDIFSFYKTDPAFELGLQSCGKPVVRRVRLRDMLSEETYRRARLNPLRLHRQFVLGNERRCFYDFFMLCCGPIPMEYRISHAAHEIVAAIGSDGTYLESAQIGGHLGCEGSGHPANPASVMVGTQ